MSLAFASQDISTAQNSDFAPKKDPTPASILTPLFAALRTAHDGCIALPASAEARTLFNAVRRQVVQGVLAFPRRQIESPDVAETRALIQQIAVSGINDAEATPEDFALATTALAQSWPGLLAAMLLVPSWQFPQAPNLDAVPDWLWGDFSSWLFTPPQGFCAVRQVEAYAEHMLRRLKELTTWVERNAGSTAVRAALNAYLKYGSGIPLYFSQQSLKEQAILRGKLLARAIGAVREDYDPLILPREGRRLRIGFVNRHFSPQTETYTTLPTFEQLDPERFEVILFSCRTTDTPLENYCRLHSQEFHVLPTELPAQLETLRAANLDVVVFGTNVTANCNEITCLALHRVAPLQVVNNSSCITTGFPTIDLYVSGTLTETESAPEQFTERLALLPGPSHAFNYQADRQSATTAWNRSDVGIPEDAVVFVSAANYFKIIPEMQHAWAQLLAQVPGSYLLVHPFNPNWSSSYPSDRFCAEMDRALSAAGVDQNRLIVSTLKFPSREDVKELLRLGDVYLDTYPFGGVNSLVDPLELGLPVVVWEGDNFRSRMGAALLRSLGLTEQIASDADAYQRIAQHLGTDASARAAVHTRTSELMEKGPLFLDPLASSDAFGELMLLAFDDLASVGRVAFRSETKPIQAEVVDAETLVSTGNYLLDLGMADEAARQVHRALAAQPTTISTRQFMAKILTSRGQFARATDYLLAAVRSGEAPAPVWRELAVALRRNGRGPDAISAIETALRVDRSDVESWFLLGEIAHQCGHRQIIQDVSEIVAKLAPEDPRTGTILAYLAAQPSNP